MPQAAPQGGLVKGAATAGRPAAPESQSFMLYMDSGESAVAAASTLAKMKSASVAEEPQQQQGIRSAAGKTFHLENGIWTDGEATPDAKPVLAIKYLSDAYFAALKINPGLKDIFALGDRIRVKLSGCVLEIGPEGKDRLSPDDEKLLNTM